MIRVEVDTDQVTAALDRLARSLTDMTPLMQDLGEALVNSTEERFPQGVSPDGTAWAPKSPVTVARQSGTDIRPLFGPSGRLSSEIFHQAGPTSVEIGSSLIYSAVQQFGAAQGAFGKTARGGPIPWGDIPARPFLGISAEDEITILDIIDEYLEAASDGD